MKHGTLLGGYVLVGTGDSNSSLVEAGEIGPFLIIADDRAVDYPHRHFKGLGQWHICTNPCDYCLPGGHDR
jgi:hypothetical protein